MWPGSDPIRARLRAEVRGFIETLLKEERLTLPSRPRYGRRLVPK